MNKRISALKIALYEELNEKFRGYAVLGTYLSSSLDSVFRSIDIKKEDKELGRDRYRGVIRSRVLKKLDEIKTCEGQIKRTKLVTSLEYLLKNRSSDNSEIIQYLLDPRRCGRG